MARKRLLFLILAAVLAAILSMEASCALFSKFKAKDKNVDTYDLTGDNSGIQDEDEMEMAAVKESGPVEAGKSPQQPQVKSVPEKAAGSAKTGTSFADIKNRVWRLSELWSGPGKVVFDRAKMTAAGLGDVYTIQFIDTGVNGKAAPNRYFAAYDVPYDINSYLEGHNLALRPLLGTQLAATINVGALMEGEYYYYLQRVNRWDLVDGKLQLYADITASDSVTLCFE